MPDKYDSQDQHDHHDHHKGMAADFKRRFWISLITTTVPVLLLSPMIRSWLGLTLS
jgi:Cu2+-exporting ATPase